jgi:hypothetical protein
LSPWRPREWPMSQSPATSVMRTAVKNVARRRRMLAWEKRVEGVGGDWEVIG